MLLLRNKLPVRDQESSGSRERTPTSGKRHALDMASRHKAGATTPQKRASKFKTKNEAALQQAQHIWNMLDEMAQNDPEAYKRFIDKNMREGELYHMLPQPHMCIRTHMMVGVNHQDMPCYGHNPENQEQVPSKSLLYINVCSWTRVPLPESDLDPIPITGGNLEWTAGCFEGEYYVVATAFNPKVLEDFGKHGKSKEDLEILIQLILDFLESNYRLKLSGNNHLLDDVSHKGSLQKLQESLMQPPDPRGSAHKKHSDQQSPEESTLMIDSNSLLNQLSNIVVNSEPQEEEIVSVEAGVEAGQTEAEIKLTTEAKPAKPGLIQELSSSSVELKTPKYSLELKRSDDGQRKALILTVELLGVRSAGACELDISPDDVVLNVPYRYKLRVQLPHKVNEDEASARFIKHSSHLVITLPVLRTR